MKHIVVAIFTNTQHQILVAKRQAHQYFGGYWEFPGGKVEADEALDDALARECIEEVGLTVINKTPLLDFTHTHPNGQDIHIHVWRITEYAGKAHGAEDQEIRWVKAEQLSEYEFLPANGRIIELLLTAP